MFEKKDGKKDIEKRQRLFWIDSLRAFAIFCIVWGHALRNATCIYPWLYCFHVPLCVMTSGIVFSRNKRTYFEFFGSKFISLMIPYYCFAIISIVLYALLGNVMEKSVEGEYNVSFLQSVKGMIYANSGTGLMRWNMPLWYLPMLFVMLIFGWFLYNDNQLKIYDWLIFGGSVLVAAICYTFIKNYNLPFGIETAIYMFPFFAFGRLVIDYDHYIQKVPIWIRLAIGLILITSGTLMSKSAGQISYNSDNYGAKGYIYFAIMSLLFCGGFYFVFRNLGKEIAWVSYLGKRTIGVMVMHKFPILFFIGVFSITRKINDQYPLISSLLISVLSIGLCLVASEAICRICSF